MLGERHDLYHEFPKHSELIQQLLASDQEFAAMCKVYDNLDAEIVSLEERGEPVTDEVAEAMKYKRAHLKDKLYAILKERSQ